MKVQLLGEYGYEWAALGFSLSYNSSIERAKEILPKFAFGKPGESKFLESIYLWIDITAPRFFWQEVDTYRHATKQSESTMHTLMKHDLTNDNFELALPATYIAYMNFLVRSYKEATEAKEKKKYKLELKNALPEGFLQRRIMVINYKTLQNIYIQRFNHELPQWRVLLDTLLTQIEHPEFISVVS